MKKRFVVFLLISMIALSFTVPAIAMEVVETEPVNAVVEQEVIPRTEVTQFYWRTYNGVLQWRVWGLTSGRWLTEWTDL